MGLGKSSDDDCIDLAKKKEKIKTMAKPDPKLQIRKLPYRIHLELSRLLDIPGEKDWRSLIAVLPDGMYTTNQIGMLENVSRANKSPSSELLTDLGYQLVTVKQLIAYLTKLNHQEALLLLKENEPVRIIKQPSSISALEGSCISLKCMAKGFPKPTYQWFKDEDDELDTGVDKELMFKDLSLEDVGEYYCKVSNDVSSECTEVVTIDVVPQDSQRSTGQHARNFDPVRRPGFHFNETGNDQLRPIDVYPGQHFVLSCGIEDRPDLKYYWMKNGHEMPGENNSKLIFDPFQEKDVGYYSCRIIGTEGEMLTKLMQLKVGNMNFPDRQFATGKVALIIGNQDYEHKRSPNEELVHPVDDAKTFASVLREMGYRVLCLVNLTKDEMLKAIDGFCELLRMAEGMYGLFYFGGHGYEEDGKTYLVPVDAPKDWNAQVTVCAEEILSQMQKTKTKLDVLILDVCRASSGNAQSRDESKSFDPPFIPGAQSVICYATCPQSQAFDRRSDVLGIYMKHLLKHIKEDKKIEEVIHGVHMDVSKETQSSIHTKNMSPTYRSSTTNIFSLCDPVLHDIDGDPTEKWFQHHRLPSSQLLEFENGIQVNVSFESVCSNICNLILHVINTGDTIECDVSLYEISKDLRIEERHMNHQIAVSMPFIARSNPAVQQNRGRQLNFSKMTILPNLQKLPGNVVLTLEAVYKTSPDMGKHAHKPLVKHAHKPLVIGKSEFGITALFEK